MSASSLLDNLLAWSAQIGVIMAIAALAALTLKHPRARLVFWQGTLAIALLLPVVEPWAKPAEGDGSVSVSTSAFTIVPPASTRPAFRWQREYLLGLITAGALLRALWIASGLIRLRRHRLAARSLTLPPVPFESAHVRWYLSDTISGPVTFGWLRPSILLPTRVNEFPADLREAIACHELVHVRRRDWLFVLFEELIRGMFWFHPAVWYALSQIQLAREQVVDLEVVRLTRDRERYLDALLAVAAHKFLPDVAPAPLFLKKRQLAVRVAAVLKETPMSKPRFVASLATVCSIALIAARLAVWFFPLQSPAQSLSETGVSVPSDGAGVTVDAGGKLMHRTPVFYPRGAKASGTVVVEANLNSKGEVADARVLSGPDELRRASLQSVLQWHYSPEAGVPPTVRVSIKFDGPPANVAGAPGASISGVLSSRPPSQVAMTLKGIEFFGISADLEQKLRDRLPVREGDTITAQTLARVSEAAHEIDEHFNVMTSNSLADGRRETTLRISLGVAAPPARGGVGSGVGSGVGGGVAGGVASGVASNEAPAAVPTGNPQRIRVGGNVQAANLIIKVTPPYPPLAKQARIQGVVRFTVTIDKEGYVQSLEPVSGHPLLVEAATEAVKQWVYKPTLLNGQPVEVITQIDVNFTLSE